MDKKQLAPIALFVYERTDTLKQTVKALQRNTLAPDSDLYIYADGPRQHNTDKVARVREYIRGINGFKSVSIIERDSNLGLAKSLIAGISELTESSGDVIVVEDDIVTAPYFLKFLNLGLQMYRDHPKVISICAATFPVSRPIPESFFLQMTHSWGWATWRKTWALHNPDANTVLEELKTKNLLQRYNNASSVIINNARILQGTAAGRIDSWHSMWNACAVINDMYSLFPGRALACNIGFGSGTNCRVKANIFKEDLYPEEILPHFTENVNEPPGFAKRVKKYYLKQHLRLLFQFFYQPLVRLFRVKL